MATLVGNEGLFIDTLKNLIELDYDAIAAYQAAIDRIDDPQTRTQLTQFKGDHERHTRELGEIVRELGETPPTEGDFKAYLTKGKVIIGNLTGDSGILKAMKSNEDDTNAAYERALARTDVSPFRAKEILERNLADERRHRAWIEQRLGQLG
ncbi:MAG: PA2169 family four-helix-bundle protein [Pseudomonadota bacterium]|nr:PA2169 family four-helix-bundle protein [Pseudomonadota bacterium]